MVYHCDQVLPVMNLRYILHELKILLLSLIINATRWDYYKLLLLLKNIERK